MTVGDVGGETDSRGDKLADEVLDLGMDFIDFRPGDCGNLGEEVLFWSQGPSIAAIGNWPNIVAAGPTVNAEWTPEERC